MGLSRYRRAVADCLHGGFGGVVWGHQNHICDGRNFHNAVKDVEAGHLRHHQVGLARAGMVLVDQRQRLAAPRSGINREPIAGERRGEQVQAAWIVVENDDGNSHRTECAGYRVQGSGVESQGARSAWFLSRRPLMEVSALSAKLIGVVRNLAILAGVLRPFAALSFVMAMTSGRMLPALPANRTFGRRLLCS